MATALTAISGTKIFISSGEHDLALNIIHLVLARIEGAPQGTKGISLFIVPKILVGADGSLGERNRRLLRLDRAQDGHPRQRHLRDELRRREGLPHRRGEQGPQRHVRDDERGAPRRRRAGPCAIGGRLPERRRLREGAPARARARPGRRQPEQAGRSHSRAPRRAARADVDPSLQRGGPRLRALDGAQGRCRRIAPTMPPTRQAARGPSRA